MIELNCNIFIVNGGGGGGGALIFTQPFDK